MNGLEKAENNLTTVSTTIPIVPSRSLPPTPAHVSSPVVVDTATQASVITSNNEVLDLSLKKSKTKTNNDPNKHDVGSPPAQQQQQTKSQKLFQRIPQSSATT